MDAVNAISPEDRRPLYVKAIKAITEMVETGKLPVGSQLPPEGELAEMLGISRSTLREALGHLETYGMVTRQQGRGTFVTASQGPDLLGGIERLETFRELADRANKNPGVVDRKVELVTASEQLQEYLKIDPGTKLIRVEIVESIDDTPCMYLEDYVIADDALEEDLMSYQGSILTYLIEQREPSLSYARTKIFAVSATADIARKLSVEKGQPVLHLIEKMYDAVGELIAITFMYLVTNHFYFSVTRRVPPR
jgi:GntR family transcriptional regulator